MLKNLVWTGIIILVQQYFALDSLASEKVRNEHARIHALAEQMAQYPHDVYRITRQLREVAEASDSIEVKKAAIWAIKSKSETFVTHACQNAMDELYYVAAVSDSPEVYEEAIRALSSKFDSFQPARRAYAITLIFRLAKQSQSVSVRQLGVITLQIARNLRGGRNADSYLEDLKSFPVGAQIGVPPPSHSNRGLLSDEILWLKRTRATSESWANLIEAQLKLIMKPEEYVRRVLSVIDDTPEYRDKLWEVIYRTMDHYLSLKPNPVAREALSVELGAHQIALQSPTHWGRILNIRLKLATTQKHKVQLMDFNWDGKDTFHPKMLSVLSELIPKLSESALSEKELESARKAIRKFRKATNKPQLWSGAIKAELGLAKNANDFFQAINITDWWELDDSYQLALKDIIEEETAEKFFGKNPSPQLVKTFRDYIEYLKLISNDKYWDPCGATLIKI